MTELVLTIGEPVNPIELLQHLRARPQMFLMDDRWVTTVTFVQGLDAATGRALLDGFSAWVAVRRGLPGSAVGWPAQIFEEMGGRSDVAPPNHWAAIDPALNAVLIEATFDRIFEYLSLHGDDVGNIFDHLRKGR